MLISVIVSTHNRADLLKTSLESLLCQTIAPNQYELIVGDSYSENFGKENKKIVEELKLKYPSHNIHYFYEKVKGGYSLTRNSAVRIAKSDYIVFGDDDFIASQTFVESCLESLREENVGLVTGSLIPKFEEEPSDEILNFFEESEFATYCVDFTVIQFKEDVEEIPSNFVWASNFGCRKDIFLKYGGFPPDGFAGDLMLYNTRGETELAERINNDGYKVKYSRGMSAEHHVMAYRFTKNYFKNRSYHYGINSSYSKIFNGNDSLDFRILFSIKNIIKYLKFYILQIFNQKLHLKFIKQKGYMNGFLDHYNYVKKSKFMQDYMTNTNWLDYDFSKLRPICIVEESLSKKILKFLFTTNEG